MKPEISAPKPASIKIKVSQKINVDRQELKLDNSIELIKTAIDSIDCPYCSTTIFIIHDLNNKKPLPNYLYCPNCKKNIFSKIIAASKIKKLDKSKHGGY